MSLYVFIRIIHSSCAVLSLLGFAWRGLQKVIKGQVPEHFVVKVLPHIVDTVLLLSAIVLVVMSGQYPFVSPWVSAKVLALLIYISLGILLMRWRGASSARPVIYALTLLCGLYMITVAITKNPMPF